MLLRQELPILSSRKRFKPKNILTAETPLKNFQRPGNPEHHPESRRRNSIVWKTDFAD